MVILKGIAASPGYAIGRAAVIQREDMPVRERFVRRERIESEVERFEAAVERSKRDIETLQERMSIEVGKGSAAIFGAHLWVLSDQTLHREVLRRIKNNRFSAEYAIDRALQKYIVRLRALDDAYLSQRIQDLEDIERRLLDTLRGAKGPDIDESPDPVVVVAHSLSPSQTASFDRTKVMGIATDVGGRTAHAAILARDLGIPAVVGLEVASADVDPGEMIIIDGQRGVLVVSPDERTLAKYERLVREYQGYEEKLTAESHLPAQTLDGTRVAVYGNIEFPEEIPSVVEHGAEGIGLYRTEFLFLREGKVPREKEHVEAYRAALRFLGGLPIYIRTVDLGADKVMTGPHGITYQEKNPFLGCRSVRLCQHRPEIFKTQIRAILQVAAEGNVKCMLPMITSVSELRWAKATIDEVRDELRRESIPYAEKLDVGIMIEVPAAAMMADSLAKESAFFSIGTNDLIQYTLAVDRTNERVAHMFTPAEPAVLRLIKNVIDAGQRNKIDVSMCGEMAGDPQFVTLLLGMGLRSFSVAPAQAAQIKKLIRSTSVESARQLADGVLKADSRENVMAALVGHTDEAGVQFSPSDLEASE
jgi:phosphotransferase system enzyme I (PtsI)